MFLKYNGVEMKRVQITRFHAENEYSGDGYNAMGRRYELDGIGVIATGETPIGGTSSVVTIDQVRGLLTSPRKLLQYKFQDSASYTNLATSSDGWNGTSKYDGTLATVSDARNGPIPNVTIQRIVGSGTTATFFVAFSFKWFGCSEDRVQRFDFTLTQNIDASGYTTMNYNGSLELSNRWSTSAQQNTPVASTGNWGPKEIETMDVGPMPDLYRRLVAPVPPNQYYRRQKQNYVSHPNLRTLTWDIEDKELFRAMPGGSGTNRSGYVGTPEGDASFTYSRGIDQSQGGLNGRKTFEMTLRADRETDPAAIIEYIFRASTARIAWLPTPGVQNSKPDIIESVSIVEPNIYTDNKLTVTITAIGSDATTTQVPFNVITRMFTSLAAQTGGNAQFADAYQSQAYFGSKTLIDPLKFEICSNIYETLNEVLTPPADSIDNGTNVDDKPFGSQPAEIPDDLVNPNPERDPAFTGESDGAIRAYSSKQKIETYDTGMVLLEATGGLGQWPVQLRTPVVIVTQTVEMTTLDKTMAVPWPTLPGEAVVVKRQEMTIDDAPLDVSGKNMYTIIATRAVQVSVPSSQNRRMNESDGVPRVTWAPDSVPQARGPLSANKQFDMRLADVSGTPQRQDYVA